MISYEVIIVGGGPAGSTCAWRLKQSGVQCAILEKSVFPRAKLCAGWITPQVLSALNLDLNNYPHSLTSFEKLHFHFYGKAITIKTQQYAIRRYEFDDWLLSRSGVLVHNHEVRKIIKDGEHYIIDDKFRCKYLVGAGGTYCPVYRTFFQEKNPRIKDKQITTLEEEFVYDYHDANCYLWFFENRLPGYSWYVPKKNGYVNIGIGGVLSKLRQRGDTIKSQWNSFVQKLRDLSLIDDRSFDPKGYNYFLRQNRVVGQINRCYIVGDSAGLATKDMGEGIGRAIESGILAAYSIVNRTQYSLRSISKYSMPKMLLKFLMRLS
ncbi:MAG: NAD(P)/FAD-dependent oxidoreductase [Pseudomonadota bacterium]